MGGTSKQEQSSTQQSQLTPWANAVPGINGILSGLNPSINSLGGGPQVQDALGQISGIANGGNPLGPAAVNAATGQLGGGANYGKATNLLNSSYNAASGALSPYASGNPYASPAVSQELSTARNDVMNQVNPMFSAAGRLGSPDNYQALGRGITQAETPILEGAANRQLQAGGLLGSLGLSTAGGLSGADAANAGIQSQGIGNAANAYGAQMLGPQALLNAGLTANQLPIQNASNLMGILGPLAAQFGQNNGSGQTTAYNTMSPAQAFATWGQGFNSFMNPFKSAPTPTMPTG